MTPGEISVGGGTHLPRRCRYGGDLGGTLGFPVEKLGLHTIHSARPPDEPYSLGALISSHKVSLGH